MRSSTHPFRLRPKPAFSLVELVLLITVAALAVPPIITLFCQTVFDSSQATLELRAVELAKSLTEEVLSRQFDSDGIVEDTRAEYDDVDDYNGYSQAPPTDCRGTAIAAYAPFRTSVTVENVSGDDPGGAAVPAGSSDCKRVTVVVSWGTGNKARSVRLVSMIASENDLWRPPVLLTFLSRQSSNDDDVTFRVRNDSTDGIYITNVIATWSSPTAWYERVSLSAVGYINYGTVWDYSQTNYVRMESGGNAMFNQGDLVYVPAGTTMEICLSNFRSSRTSWWPSSRDVEHTAFTIEIWAGPDHCVPFFVPAF